MSITPITTWGLLYGMNTVFDWEHQKKVLDDSIQRIKNIFSDLPKELKLSPGSEPGHFEQIQPTNPADSTTQYQYPYTNGQNLTDGGSIQRRHIQYEIQKANLYVSPMMLYQFGHTPCPLVLANQFSRLANLERDPILSRCTAACRIRCRKLVTTIAIPPNPVTPPIRKWQPSEKQL